MNGKVAAKGGKHDFFEIPQIGKEMVKDGEWEAGKKKKQSFFLLLTAVSPVVVTVSVSSL